MSGFRSSTFADAPIVERTWPHEGQFGIRLPEPPCAWADYPALLEMAELLLATRRERFPRQVAKGELTQEAADNEIHAFEQLVRDWQFICSGEGEPAPHRPDRFLRDALDEAILRIADYADQHGWSDRLQDQAHSIIALRWHLEPGRKTVAMAQITHRLREQFHPRKEPANV